jgi:hypothetical protein
MNINANVKTTSKKSINDDTTFSPTHYTSAEKCTEIKKIQNSANVVQKYRMKLPYNGYQKIYAFGVSKSRFIDFVFKHTHKSFDQTKIRIKTNVLVEKNSDFIKSLCEENKGKFIVEMENGDLKLFTDLEKKVA